MLNGEPGRLRLACKLGDCYNRGGSAQCKYVVLLCWLVGQQNVVCQGHNVFFFFVKFAHVPCLLCRASTRDLRSFPYKKTKICTLPQ
jgi:hypothetical protein